MQKNFLNNNEKAHNAYGFIFHIMLTFLGI